MAEVNLYYHKQTNSWWTNSELDGIHLTNYVKNNPIGLGTIEMDTNDKTQVCSDGMHEVYSIFIPDYIKNLNGISQEIEENGLANATKVSKRQLKRMLK